MSVPIEIASENGLVECVQRFPEIPDNIVRNQ